MQRRQECNSTRLVAPASYTTTLHHTTPVPPSPRGQAALNQPTRAGLALSLVLYRCVAVTPGSGHIRRQRYGIDDPSYLHRNSDTRVPRGAVSAYTPAYCYLPITNTTTAVLLLWPVQVGL